MLVEHVCSAQITIILASNDPAQIAPLRRDLEASKFAYFLVLLRDRAELAGAGARQIAENGGRTPMVVVLDYRFAQGHCDVLLQTIRTVPHAATIGCVVVNPPANDALRQRLKAAGARLFDGDVAGMAEQFTLH